MRASATWLTLIAAPLGLLLIAGGGFMLATDRIETAGHVRVEGVVTDLERSRSANGSTSWRPVVSYADAAGRRREIVGSVGSNPSTYQRGDRVRVLHDPADPARARIDGFHERLFGPLMMLGVGGLFVWVGARAARSARRDARLARDLARRGITLSAGLIEVHRDANATLGGERGFRVACQAVRPATGRLHRFESEPTWVDPTEAIGDRPIPVRVDPDDPARHIVDLSGFTGSDRSR